MKNLINILSITCITIGLTSCAREISSDVYAANRVGEVPTTYQGVIKNVRQVCVDASESLEDNQTGIVGGAIAGGLVGNAISGQFIPTAAGAIAGAVGGSLIEKKLKQQTALEYIVEIQNGALMTIVQGKDNAFCIGQPVYVIVSQCGRSRIISQD